MFLKYFITPVTGASLYPTISHCIFNKLDNGHYMYEQTLDNGGTRRGKKDKEEREREKRDMRLIERKARLFLSLSRSINIALIIPSP